MEIPLVFKKEKGKRVTKMYKTQWFIYKTDEKRKAILTYYHFGKAPKFPTQYLKENITYEIELLWNIPLCKTPKIFIKCLLHKTLEKKRYHES
jgi:hypothetical protein